MAALILPLLLLLAASPALADATDRNGPPRCQNCPEPWGLRMVGWEEAYRAGHRGQGVVLAAGMPHGAFSSIDCAREDVRQSLWVNPGEDLDHDGRVKESERNNKDDDGNGCIDDFHGCHFGHFDASTGKFDGRVCWGENAEDARFPGGCRGRGVEKSDLACNHDTAVVSHAVGRNAGAGWSKIGVAPEARFMLLGGIFPLGSEARWKDALAYAQRHGVRVLFAPYASYPGRTGNGPAGALDERHCRAAADVVAPGLFDALSEPRAPLILNGFPSTFPMCHPDQLSVAPLAPDGTVAKNAQAYLPRSFVDLAMPGAVDGDATMSAGIGFAAGALAVVLSAHPSLDRAGLVARLRDTADKAYPTSIQALRDDVRPAQWRYDASGRNAYYGFGRLNLARATGSAPPP